MAGNDDIVASLRVWAPLVVKWAAAPAAGQVMENAATALTERDAQIERLKAEHEDTHRALTLAGKTLTAIDQAVVEMHARATTAERDLAEARAEVERKDAALAPFADMADYIDAETEGVSDADEVDVMFHDFLFARWPISHFRCARAALTAGGENGDA